MRDIKPKLISAKPETVGIWGGFWLLLKRRTGGFVVHSPDCDGRENKENGCRACDIDCDLIHGIQLRVTSDNVREAYVCCDEHAAVITKEWVAQQYCTQTAAGYIEAAYSLAREPESKGQVGEAWASIPMYEIEAAITARKESLEVPLDALVKKAEKIGFVGLSHSVQFDCNGEVAISIWSAEITPAVGGPYYSRDDGCEGRSIEDALREALEAVAAARS